MHLDDAGRRQTNDGYDFAAQCAVPDYEALAMKRKTALLRQRAGYATLENAVIIIILCSAAAFIFRHAVYAFTGEFKSPVDQLSSGMPYFR